MFSGIYLIVLLVVMVLAIVACWKIYTKAGEPGWASLVPFYSNYVLFKIVFGNGWLFLLLLVPVVNGIISIILLFKLAKVFGHGVGFGFGLLFLAPIFLLILAFGSSEYEGV
ncbi:MAG: hypothetical protein K2H34_02510 [Lachnospiraceae bacterium]|nr:hypothetical protein [Lachnospiraceae bacterium]